MLASISIGVSSVVVAVMCCYFVVRVRHRGGDEEEMFGFTEELVAGGSAAPRGVADSQLASLPTFRYQRKTGSQRQKRSRASRRGESGREGGSGSESQVQRTRAVINPVPSSASARDVLRAHRRNTPQLDSRSEAQGSQSDINLRAGPRRPSRLPPLSARRGGSSSVQVTVSPARPKMPSKPPSTVTSEEGECCCICLLEFEQGDNMKRLPCAHVFHTDCIDRWLRNSCECPLCKGNVVTGLR